MGRRIGTALVGVLLAAGLVGCARAEQAAPPPPPRTYPASFDVPDAEFDAETTVAATAVRAQGPNLDLVGIAARVGYDGIRATFRYAPSWLPDSPARWGVRFEIVGSDGSRISGAWTQDPESSALTREVQLGPKPAGCTARPSFAAAERRLAITLSPGCLPGVTAAEPRPWISFDTLESVSSWHRGDQILYGWDQLYARVVAPDPERLYLPRRG
ncbi:MAG: hypothetical protein ACJ72O_09415 [Marmoricola sp.]